MTVMARVPRMLTAAAALLLGALFIAPLWSIRLVAPQYPEGLGFLIHVNTITGMKENDLNSINGLNHYIGMRAIEPGAIPELRYMPWIVAGIIVFGVLVALMGRRRLLIAWLAAFALLGAAGMYDFWRWGYDYGHNLSGDAIIEVPGMSYQPPLIGSKQLLNFRATSWPAAGGIAAGLAFVLGLAAVMMAYRRSRPAMLVAAMALAAPHADAQRRIEVSPGLSSPIAAAVRKARAGDTVVIHRGVYREPTVIITVPLMLLGEPGAVLDGSAATHILRIEADDVTVRGLRFQDVSRSHVEDRAAIRAGAVRHCRIEDNHIRNAFFGIYLAGTNGCRVARNTLEAAGRTEDQSGNGIHLWTASNIEVLDNRIRGHRDGIYLEFAHFARVAGNTSEDNIRYGLHFMYADDSQYARNVFRRNRAGVAVMYTNRVAMANNRFEESWGAAAYGLLLKEVYDARLTDNVFASNTTALVADGATRVIAAGNEFANNGWGLRLLASTQDAEFTGNTFRGNTFDVSTNSRATSARMNGNVWDTYRGFDLDHDGRGDVPHHPVRLFSLIVEQNRTALILLRSPIVALLDAAERTLPSLTPETLTDSAPRMRRMR